MSNLQIFYDDENFQFDKNDEYYYNQTRSLSSSSNQSYFTGKKKQITDGSAKTVKFAEGTAGPRQAVLAVSITKFDNLENLGYTEYTIQVYRNGRLWSIQRRYRDFEKLSKDMKKENVTMKQELPTLPQKRWFQAKRWLNRFDDSYSFDRQLGLQEYLRTLVKNPIILKDSISLRTFLEVDDAEDLSPFDYESTRDRNVIVYEMEEEVSDDESGYAPYRDTEYEYKKYASYQEVTDAIMRNNELMNNQDDNKGNTKLNLRASDTARFEWKKMENCDDESSDQTSYDASSQGLEPMLQAVARSLSKEKDSVLLGRLNKENSKTNNNMDSSSSESSDDE